MFGVICWNPFGGHFIKGVKQMTSSLFHSRLAAGNRGILPSDRSVLALFLRIELASGVAAVGFAVAFCGGWMGAVEGVAACTTLSPVFMVTTLDITDLCVDGVCLRLSVMPIGVGK